MPHTASILRSFWLNNLNNISGSIDSPTWLNMLDNTDSKNDAGLAGWLSIDNNFLITNNLKKESFKLSPIGDLHEDLLRSYAFDLCKFGMASMETLHSLKKNEDTPKSTGWAIIQTYYAAFFAAHAILRLFGISCTQLNAKQTTNINKIGNQLGFGQNEIQGGFYCCTFDSEINELNSVKLNASKDGSHGSMWREFNKFINLLQTDIDSNGTGLKDNKEKVKKMLASISLNLTHGQYTASANWLSNIRNKTNYKQLDGAWFPFKGYKKEYKDIFEITNKWINKPTEITLITPNINEFRSFVSTCTVIVSLYREISVDMSSRCSEGKSFHNHLSLRYLRQIKVKTV